METYETAECIDAYIDLMCMFMIVMIRKCVKAKSRMIGLLGDG